jgi:hypothetical protein
MTYRVEVTRDETVATGGVGIEITAYIDRVPETPAVDVGRLTRAPKGVWNSRLLFSGDFDTLAEALAAIEATYPDIAEIRCSEFSIDYEFPNEMAPLRKSDGKWLPGPPPAYGPPPQLDWRVG